MIELIFRMFMKKSIQNKIKKHYFNKFEQIYFQKKISMGIKNLVSKELIYYLITFENLLINPEKNLYKFLFSFKIFNNFKM